MRFAYTSSPFLLCADFRRSQPNVEQPLSSLSRAQLTRHSNRWSYVPFRGEASQILGYENFSVACVPQLLGSARCSAQGASEC